MKIEKLIKVLQEQVKEGHLELKIVDNNDNPYKLIDVTEGVMWLDQEEE